MVGNEQSRLEILRWLKHWTVGSKPLLLTGPPGIGKSTSIYAVANELGFTVIEYNASDVRTRERLREVLSPTLENSTIFGGEKLLVFLDEIDGVLGRSDYAGMDYILEFIENSTSPVAMAANLEETQKLRKLEQKSQVLRFKPVSPDLITIYLRAVSNRENLEVEESALERISKNCRGDVRQALNVLQTISGGKVVGSVTDRQFMSDSSALDAIFKAESVGEVLLLMRQYDAQPFEKIRAVFDSVVSAKNLSIESKSESLDLVAMADTLLGRINREQSWRLLRYFDRYLALATCGKKIQRTDSSIPWNLKLAIWNDGRVTKAMLADLSSKLRASKSDVSSLYLGYFAQCFKKRPDLLEAFLKENEFGDSEKRVLLKMK